MLVSGTNFYNLEKLLEFAGEKASGWKKLKTSRLSIS